MRVMRERGGERRGLGLHVCFTKRGRVVGPESMAAATVGRKKHYSKEGEVRGLQYVCTMGGRLLRGGEEEAIQQVAGVKTNCRRGESRQFNFDSCEGCIRPLGWK